MNDYRLLFKLQCYEEKKLNDRRQQWGIFMDKLRVPFYILNGRNTIIITLGHSHSHQVEFTSQVQTILIEKWKWCKKRIMVSGKASEVN